MKVSKKTNKNSQARPLQESNSNSKDAELDLDLVKTNVQIINGRVTKIPRPMNAFMLFAHDNRKKIQHIFPELSNKEVSTKLGSMWKTLADSERNKYFSLAKKVETEHKQRYPNYQYSPGVARQRKRLQQEEKLRLEQQLLSVTHPPKTRPKPRTTTTTHSDILQSPPKSMYPPVLPPPPFPPEPSHQHPLFRSPLPPSSYLAHMPCKGGALPPPPRYPHHMMHPLHPRPPIPGMFPPHHMMPYRMGLSPYPCSTAHVPQSSGSYLYSTAQCDPATQRPHDSTMSILRHPLPIPFPPAASGRIEMGPVPCALTENEHNTDMKKELNEQHTSPYPVVFFPYDATNSAPIGWQPDVLSKAEEAALCRYVESISQPTSLQASLPPVAEIAPITSTDFSYVGPVPPGGAAALNPEEVVSQYQALQSPSNQYIELSKSPLDQAVTHSQATPKEDNNYFNMSTVTAKQGNSSLTADNLIQMPANLYPLTTSVTNPSENLPTNNCQISVNSMAPLLNNPLTHVSDVDEKDPASSLTANENNVNLISALSSPKLATQQCESHDQNQEAIHDQSTEGELNTPKMRSPALSQDESYSSESMDTYDQTSLPDNSVDSKSPAPVSEAVSPYRSQDFPSPGVLQQLLPSSFALANYQN